MFKTARLLALFFCITTTLVGTVYCQEPATPAEPPSAVQKAEADKTAAREEALKKAKVRREQLIKQMQEQQAKEQAAALAKQSEYPYQSTKFIPVKSEAGNGRLFSFCMSPDEKLYCIVTPGNVGYALKLDGNAPEKQVTATPEVVVLNLEGEEQQRWSVGFKPDRLTVSANGTVYVGGAGKLAKFSSQGKLLQEIDLPHLAEELKNEEEIKAAAIEERDEQLEMYHSQAANYEQYVEKKKALEEKEKQAAEKKAAEKAEGNTAAAEPEAPAKAAGSIELIEEDFDVESHYLRLSLKQLSSMQKNMQKQVDRLKSISDEDLVKDFKQSLSSKNTIHALTMAGDSLIYTTRQLRGYGYAVWKVNAELSEPVKIMQGLGGCCGQCDVQCRGDKLYVADNTKHRVAVYDLSGKKLTQHGKKGRDGDGDSFGGCCNPMNVSFSPTGQILTAESEGYIKCFSPDGEFETLLGRSLLESGCKHVALNMTKDGKYIVFLDQPGSRLVRLEKSAAKPGEVRPVEKTTSKPTATDKSSE